jgi:regulatory factor X
MTDCGIRPATSAEAEWLQDYIHKSNNHAGQPSVTAARLSQDQSETSNRGEDRSDEDDDEDSEGNSANGGSKRNSLSLNGDVKGGIFNTDLSDKTPTAATLLSQVQAAQRAPGSFPIQASIRRHPTAEPGIAVQSHSPQSTNGISYPASQHPISVRQFPHFPSIDEAVGANSTTPHGVAAREVWGWFQDHLDSLLESVRSFRFDQFEMHLRTFWSNLGGSHREIVHAPAIAGLMAKADAIVYDVGYTSTFFAKYQTDVFLGQEILEILRSQMLSPISTNSLTNLRQFANKMEKILLMALDNYGSTFVEPKVELGARFGHLVCKEPNS